MSLISKQKYAVAIIGLVIIAVSSITYQSRLNVVASGQVRRTLKEDVLTPFDAAAESADPVQKQSRAEKNRRFNKSIRAFSLLDQAPDEYAGTLLETPPAALPVGSDLVVVGKIDRRQPYLSENMTVVYTETTVKVEEILKSEPPTNVQQNDFLIVDREGGAIRTPNGKTFRYVIAGLGLPQVAHRYVLFLQRQTKGDYKLLSGYELIYGKVFGLEDFSDREPYVSLTETQFLTLLKEKIANETSKEGRR